MFPLDFRGGPRDTFLYYVCITPILREQISSQEPVERVPGGDSLGYTVWIFPGCYPWISRGCSPGVCPPGISQRVSLDFPVVSTMDFPVCSPLISRGWFSWVARGCFTLDFRGGLPLGFLVVSPVDFPVVFLLIFPG